MQLRKFRLRGVVRLDESAPALCAEPRLPVSFVGGDRRRVPRRRRALQGGCRRETLYLGRLLVNAVNSFALDAVVFAGEIVYRFEEIFAARLQKIVEEGSIKKKKIKIVTSKIGNVEILASANLVGESDGQED